MERVIDYRRHAEECRSMAGRARSPDEKQMLLNMAESWESLAKDRERTLARNRQTSSRPESET
jgi:hypothetical protein